MEVNYQNLKQDIQGKWNCTKALNQINEELLSLDFALLISENVISMTGDGQQYWPKISTFELVGSIKDGYFYRQDGCFMQVKYLTEQELVIELFHKNEEGAHNTMIFYFDKEDEQF